MTLTNVWASDTDYTAGGPTKVAPAVGVITQGLIPDSPSMSAQELNWYLNALTEDANGSGDRLDEVESDVGSLQSNVSSLAGTVGGLESDVGTLQSQMGTAQGDIGSLEGRMGSAEGSIGGLQGQMSTAMGDIGTLNGQMSTAQGDINTLESDVGTAEGAIVALQAGVPGGGTTGHVAPLIIHPQSGIGVNTADLALFLEHDVGAGNTVLGWALVIESTTQFVLQMPWPSGTITGLRILFCPMLAASGTEGQNFSVKVYGGEAVPGYTVMSNGFETTPVWDGVSDAAWNTLQIRALDITLPAALDCATARLVLHITSAAATLADTLILGVQGIFATPAP